MLTGLLPGDPSLYIITPLVSVGKSEQVVGAGFVGGGSVGPVFAV